MPEAVKYRRLNPPERWILNPDLSNASPRSRQGLIGILEGASDPDFLKVMDEALALLRHLWDTDNKDTYLIPGSEETALEAALVNNLEPGDNALVSVSGFFGERMAQAAERVGAKVVRLFAEPGTSLTEDAIAEALQVHRPKVLALLHGDGSTGVEQPLTNLGALAHANGALLLVDCRWTLSALDLHVDAMEIDVCVSGSQKAVSAYPGLGLVTFSPRAVKAYEARRQAVQSWSLDLEQLRKYRTDERAAQTMPAPIVYALTELLQLIYEQDMPYRIGRMVNRRDAVVAGLESMGLKIYAKPGHRLSTVTAVLAPDGVDAARVRQRLLRPYRIDIGGGLGDLSGKVWRIGVMGHSAQPTFFAALMTLLEVILEEEGYPVPNKGEAARALLNTLDP